MNSKKREFNLYSFYDHANIQAHLEAMAAKGWMLEKLGNTFWTYRQAEPKTLHFSVTYFPNASDFDSVPGEDQETFRDYCAAAGWQPVASWFQMLVFVNETENPVPVETDAAFQVDTIHLAMKRSFLIGQAVMIALALLQIGMNLSDLIKHTTDTLANSSFLFVIFSWALVIVLCGTELISYLLWHRRAKRAAVLDGSFTPTRSHRSFQITCLVVLLPCVLLWLHSLEPLLAAVGVGSILLMILLQFLLNGIKQLMKRTGCSAAVNRAVTLVGGFLLAFALISGMTWGGARLVRDPPGRETYQWQGDSYDVHPIGLPLTMEDLTGQPYEHVSREQHTSKTPFLARRTCRETVGQPQKQVTLRYEVTDIRQPWLRDIVVRDYLENTDLVGYIRTLKITFERSWLPEEAPDAWGADAAYRRYWGKEQKPTSDYLLFYGDRVVEVSLPEEPTNAQRAIIGEKLSPHT